MNVNKVFLGGNLTRDPQLSYLPSQTAVADFGLAVNESYTTKDGGKKESTLFVDCKAFGKPAETIAKYVTKGKPLFVEGKLTLQQWEAKDGTKRSKHIVTVSGFQFVGGDRSEAAPPAKNELPDEPINNDDFEQIPF